MKKLLLSLGFALAAFPIAAFADHLRGSFHSYGEDHVTITDSAHPDQQIKYGHSGKVVIVDEAGVAVDHHALKAGHPVTVHYSGEGHHRTVSRVIVHKQVVTKHHD